MNIEKEKIDILHMTQVLSDMQVGFWIIELPLEGSPKMYGDMTMQKILGITSDSLTPEEFYTYWTEKINHQYIDAVMQAVEAVKRGEVASVKYLWQHPKRGWVWVSCGGYLDKSYEDGIRLKGYQYDATDELETNVIDIGHEIVDAKKLKLYSPYIIENAEELYEIDCETLNINTIFYEKDKYNQIEEGKNIFSVIKNEAHPDYVDLLSSVFEPHSLQSIVEGKQTRQIEFKARTVSGEYCWVEAKIFPVNVAGSIKLLFCVSDISDKKRVVALTNEKNELVDAFYNVYSSIVEINLDKEEAHVLKSDTERIDHISLSIEQLQQLIADDFAVDSERSTIQRFLDIHNLKAIANKQDNSSLDFRLREDNERFKWKRIDVLCLPNNKDRLYLVFSDVNEKHIMESVLKHFVFNTNDYLYCIDVRNNTFLNFDKNSENVVLPPQRGVDYKGEMIKYTRKYVPLEDQERVIELMMPEYIIKRLQKEGYYKFDAGMIDENYKYRRKEVTIQSYDRENDLLFISRRDITDEYFKQKNQREALKQAHMMANTDALTRIRNRKGACQEIEKQLADIRNATDAFIIIDLDNFKAVNDCFGHSQGDELLREVGRILADNFRKTDVIARLGGDEFVIYMKNVRDEKAVASAMKKLLGKLQFMYRWEQGSIEVSASAGIAMVPRDGVCFEDLYKKSDKALYSAKHQGKNKFQFFADNED